MSAAQLVFVTGKGGVGKTTVAAALAHHAARGRRRVLLVETGGERSLATLFGAPPLGSEPAPLVGTLAAVRVDPAALVESYFRRLLRVPFLVRRLFASATFRAVTAAAPGVTEFVILEHLLQWTEASRLTRRAAYDVVIVDAPASGHAVRLLRTPAQLQRLVPAGPIAGSVGTLAALLANRARTRAVLVAIPDEMAVAELLETHAAIADTGIRLAPPVLNRVWPKRFTAAEATRIAARRTVDPLVAAARLAIAARGEAERQLRRLRDALGARPVALPERPGVPIDGDELAAFGATLAPLLEDEADGR